MLTHRPVTRVYASPRGKSLLFSHALQVGAACFAVGLSACSGSDATEAEAADATSPTVTAEGPADGASDVALNTRVSATFSESMDPLTLTTTTFLVMKGATPVTGTVAPGPDGLTATFVPGADFPPSAALTARITVGAKTPAGHALTADYSWTFTTGVATDKSPPVVSSTTPENGATAVPINAKIAVTFSKPMDPVTVTATTFKLKQVDVAIDGTVTYGDAGTTASFVPSSALPSNATLTATIATGATALTGNALVAPYTWTFTTGATAANGPALVLLGTAGNFVVLAKSGVSTVPGSVITGDVGVSPAAATYLTGFSLTADGTNVFSTSPQVVGKLFAANYAVPTPANLTTAIANMAAAYTDAAGRPTPDFLELGTGNIGGETLAPGLYKWTSSITIPTDLTLAGGVNDVWIFQSTGDLSLSAAKNVILSGGAQAKHVFWQIAGHATFGATSHFEGILLTKTDVTLQTGATMNGRLLAQTQVALQKATVTQPPP